LNLLLIVKTHIGQTIWTLKELVNELIVTMTQFLLVIEHNSRKRYLYFISL